MALTLSDEQQMMKESAAGFLADHASIKQLREMRDIAENGAHDGFDRAVWAQMAEMGYAGICIPEEFGGVGLSVQEAGMIAEEMGRNLSLSPFTETAVMAADVLVRAGSAEQKQAHLPKMAAGESVIALAVNETQRHDPKATNMVASRSGNGFTLNGSKTFVPFGKAADQLIVVARVEGDENLTLFLVDPKTSGVDAKSRMKVDSAQYADIDFNNVEVNADAVIGEVDGGDAVLEKALNAGRAVTVAEMTGASQRSFEITLDYLKERKQFGEIIGGFQALQHRSAHLFAEIELLKSLSLASLTAVGEDNPFAGITVHAAKAKAGQVAQLAAQEALQMHGGIGMTDEHDIGLYMKRIRTTEQLYGDGNFHADAFATMRGF